MTSRQRLRLLAGAALTGMALAFAATPALAQTTGATGGGMTTVLQNVLNLMNTGAIRLLAVIAVIATAAVWLLGHLDLRKMATVILAIAVMFSAAGIVDAFTGGLGGN